MGEGGRGTSSSPFPQGELWGKGKPSGELLGELYIGEGEGGTLGEKQLSGRLLELHELTVLRRILVRHDHTPISRFRLCSSCLRIAH